MKVFFIYWMIGCILVGAGIGLHEKRCPMDDYPSTDSVFGAVATWPLGMVWAIVSPSLSPCKRLP